MQNHDWIRTNVKQKLDVISEFELRSSEFGLFYQLHQMKHKSHFDN